MNASLSSSALPASETTWPPPRELEDLLHRWENLAKASTSDTAFYDRLLHELRDALAAPRASAWRPDRDGFWQPLCASGDDREGRDEIILGSDHQQLLQRVAIRQQVEGVPQTALAASENADATALSPALLLVAPVIVNGSTRVLLQVDQRPHSSPAAQQGYLRFLAATAEIAADFERQQLIDKLQDHLSRWSRFEEICRALYARLDVGQTAHVIANDGRSWMECDRISVLVWNRSDLSTLAVSGVDRLNRRTAMIRHLEALAEQVARTGEAFWYSGHDAELQDEDCVPPPLQPLLQAFLDSAHSRTVGILPLVRAADRENDTKSRPVGVLVVETFGESPLVDLRHRAEALSVHCTTALHNALQYEAIPLVNVIPRWLETMQRHRLGTCGAFALIATLVLCLAFVPADLKITSQGELQPTWRRDVFSPMDGIVDQLNVKHGQRVLAGQLLATIRSPQLEFDQRKLTGEIQTVRERLNAAEVSQIENQAFRVDAREQYHRLTAEKRELKLRLASLQKQLGILRAQERDLEIRSPIDGQIITWNLTQQLDARPVNRGEALMTVVDLEGPWHIELKIPETKSGHVLAAQADSQQMPPVTFVFDSHPSQRHRGRLQLTALAAEYDAVYGATVAATVAVDTSLPRKRPGASVSAEVHCGRRSLGFVWFHELIEAVHKMWAY